MNSKLSMSPENPTARNILILLRDEPLIILKKSTGRKDSGTILEDIRSLDGQGFRVFDSGEDVCIVAQGSGRTFLI